MEQVRVSLLEVKKLLLPEGVKHCWTKGAEARDANGNAADACLSIGFGRAVRWNLFGAAKKVCSDGTGQVDEERLLEVCKVLAGALPPSYAPWPSSIEECKERFGHFNDACEGVEDVVAIVDEAVLHPESNENV